MFLSVLSTKTAAGLCTVIRVLPHRRSQPLLSLDVGQCIAMMANFRCHIHEIRNPLWGQASWQVIGGSS